MIDPQFGKVRAYTLCVVCGRNDKPTDLLLHWQCHEAQKARNDGDYSKRVKIALAKLEERL